MGELHGEQIFATQSHKDTVDTLRAALNEHRHALPTNANDRLASIDKDIGRFGEEWRPYQLASLAKDFALNLERAELYQQASEWISVALRLFRTHSEMADYPPTDDQILRVQTAQGRIRDLEKRPAAGVAAEREAPTPQPGNAEDPASGDALAFLDAGGVLQGEALRTLVDRLQTHAGASSSGTVFDGANNFANRIRDLGRASAAVSERVEKFLEEDLEHLGEFLSSAAFPPDAEQVRQLAAYSRSQAMPRNLQPTATAPRLWWLVAGACNVELVSARQWSANAPHVTLDAIGYLTAIVIQHRYDDDSRDFLASAAEIVVAAAHCLPSIAFDTSRWCLTAVGLFLLLRGPDSRLPSETKFDDRVQGLYDRREWASALLRASATRDPLHVSASAIALCQVAGEDLHRVEWILDMLFGPGAERPDAADHDYWLETCVDFVGRTKRVRVVVNPWRPATESALSSQTALIADSGTLLIPDRVLQHAVADLLQHEEAVSVNGARFAGRRVPTYLLHDSSGPFGLLKVDTAAKVGREERNFREAAQRLHWVNRPGMSQRGRMTIWVDDDTTLEAILTSHVFGPSDEPTTLTDWLEGYPPHGAEVFDDLFLGALRPWTAFVERSRVDLRMEYPVFRPRTPVLAGFAPLQKSETEVARLRRAQPWRTTSLGEERESAQAALNEASGSHPALRLSERSADPVWLAESLARGETLEGDHPASRLLDDLLDFDCLLARCHGDLHTDNVLCLNPDSSAPRLVLIDFESTHVGHICKDFARLEAALLTQVFAWRPAEAQDVLTWFAETLGTDDVWPSQLRQGHGSTQSLATVTASALRIRSLARGCGQSHWPIGPKEYNFALVGALLPIARYTTIGVTNQQLAYALAAEAAGTLVAPRPPGSDQST